MDLFQPGSPIDITVCMVASQRRKGTARSSWRWDYPAGTSVGVIEQLADHLVKVLHGKSDRHRESLHHYFESRGGCCPCRRLAFTPGLIGVSLRVTQPHTFTINRKSIHMVSLMPPITLWDTSKGLIQKRCDMCGDTLPAARYVSPCGHHFHTNCIQRWGRQHPVCPVCTQIMHFSQ